MSLGVARDTHEPAIEGVGAFVSLGEKRAFGRGPSLFTIFVVQVLASKSFPFISCLRLSLDIFTCFQIFSSFFLPLYLFKLISSFFFVFSFGLYYFCFVLLYVPLISCYALLLCFLCHFPL